MSKSTTKYSPVFFSAQDELLLETELKRVVPGLAFVEGSLWENSTPPWKNSLADCQQSVIMLWDREAVPQLTHLTLENGKVRGPTSGIVIQFCRCHVANGCLHSGDLGLGYDMANQKIASFVKHVWAVLRRIRSEPLECFDKTTGEILGRNIRNYVVGPDAYEMSTRGTFLKHCTADVYYRGT